MTFVDTNVLLDVVTDDAMWAEWSIAQLDAAAVKGSIIINVVVYAELSVRFERIEVLDQVFAETKVMMAEIPRAALFLAGKVFHRYRAAGGSRAGVLPDIFIGAHAAVAGMPLLTRDVQRYRTYFPSLVLITPQV